MTDEAQFHGSLYIRKGDDPVQLEYSSKPTMFTADVTGVHGPTPGAITVTTGGVDVDLSELTTPGFCRIMNRDDTNFIEYGIWDGSTFYPLGELGPGEFVPFKLSRNIDLGVGTAYGNLRLKADTASCNCAVDAFEK